MHTPSLILASFVVTVLQSQEECDLHASSQSNTFLCTMMGVPSVL